VKLLYNNQTKPYHTVRAQGAQVVRFQPHSILLISLLTVVLIFLGDWFTPVGMAIWGLYILPILLVHTRAEAHWLFPMIALCSGLALLSLLTPNSSPSLSIIAANRLLGVFAFWVLGYYLSRTRQSEQRLRNSIVQFRTLFDAAPIGISVVDAAGNIIETNRQAEQILGVPKHEHETRSVADPSWRIIRPDGTPMPPEEYAGMRALRENKRIDNLEMGIVQGEGAVIWLNVTAAPIPQPQRGAIIVYTDITGWRSAQQALAASEQRLAQALDAVSDGVWNWNVQTGALTYSKKWLDKYGYSVEDVNSRISFWESIVHPDDWQRVQQALEAHFSGQTPVYICENRLRTKAGEYRYNLDRGRVVEWDEQGRPLHMVGADTDITERMQSELAQAQLAAIVESSEDAILSNDLHGVITSWNRSAAQLYGYTAAEAIGQPAALLFPPECAGEMATILQRMEQGQPLSHYETEHIGRRGQRMLVSLTISPVRDRDGRVTGISLIARDITEQKALELAVHRANSELEQRVQERTAALEAALVEVRQADQIKEAFLAAISHELRTPLTGVLAVADALELQVSGPLNERQLEHVQMLRRSGSRLLEMINGILHYTKLLAGQTALRHDVCKLADIGARSVRKVQAQADRKQLTVHFLIDPPDLEIVGDSEGIFQLLYNLLDNAVKFTPFQGSLGLTIRRSDAAQVEITVWDTGGERVRG
jgi:PAS domain S-box-containing protein